jgi:predicted transcriptional regulator
MKKHDVLALLDDMPEDIDPEELMYQLYVLEKIDEGERDIEAGNVISHEELVRRSDEWLK